MQEKINKLKEELSKVIIGHSNMIDGVLMGLFSNGHIILESVPGLAKTTMIKTLANALDLNFKRVQFTPDLLPSDIIGAEIYDQKSSEFKIKKGPVFTNLLLADEINRAPAKVQSALLEVMQEKQVTISGQSFSISEPFLVLATQNPLDQIGAYELPQAQLDRFMLKILLDYNTIEEELQIAKTFSVKNPTKIDKILNTEDLATIKQEIEQVYIDDEVQKYMINLIFATRYPKNYKGLEEIEKYIEYGASPRGSIDLFKASKAYAYINGKNFVTPDDIKLIFKDVLRHRITLSFDAISNDITADFILEQILSEVLVP
ncbi:AAA family ATPase [Arcobacter sp. FWKO B]|uniref:AAA family ATPase n=1 Tax=Arcobacter sp. FWKO B TaxID=2593672 RepID=UPI0018A384CB|nr:MoxR family ATPase [Arcobacter sp. FWKO B]QOG12045.1 MoxR family ATPase [Arcobacter sp. FWKO B]